jgi:AcrR family transcriptional regulator
MDRPRKSRTRKSKAQRQREIVEATLRLVAEYGVHGTTVSRIASSAGLSRGALYNHFANREAVLFAALELMAERASPWVRPPSSPDAYHDLLDMGARHGAFAVSEFDTFVRPNVELMAISGDRAVAEQVREMVRKTIRRFLELVERGKCDGSIRPDVESEDVAWALLTFAWAEDQALALGLTEYIGSGASVRNFRRTLADVATVPDPVAERDGLGIAATASGDRSST